MNRESKANWSDCDVIVRKSCDVIIAAQKYAANGFPKTGLHDDTMLNISIRNLIPYLFRAIDVEAPEGFRK